MNLIQDVILDKINYNTFYYNIFCYNIFKMTRTTNCRCYNGWWDRIKWDQFTDFIVVGMGAAGAVVMRTLADAKFNVIGIEAGGNFDNDPLILDSTQSGRLEGEFTWKFFYNQETVPNDDIGGMTMNYTTGRMLGGGSSINGMQYVRGSNAFWSNWQAINGSNWGPAAALNGFKALENFLGVSGQYNPIYHGTSGLMKIRQAPVTATTMATKFTNALALATSSSVISDYNNPTTPLGTFTRWSLFEQSNGDRASSSTDFLTPILPPTARHQILLNTTISKVIFDAGGKAIGIEAIQNGKTIYIRANKEIILSTGIHSNEILQRSGIGPADLLNSIGIPIIFANDNVGFGSRNHLINMAIFSVNPQDVPGVPASDPQALYVGGGFLPDPTTGSDPTLRGFQWIGMNPDGNSLIVAFYKLHPQSLGKDRIQDADPLRVSAMAEDLFSNPTDLQSIINVYKIQITALAAQLAAIDPSYQLQSPSLVIINDPDTTALTAYIMSTIDHAHHWTGTCRMAPLDQGGVVDNQGYVYGVSGLRIADISIAPIQPDGNTAAPAFFVGYNIAQMIVQKYKHN